jgi:hypothetical protein
MRSRQKCANGIGAARWLVVAGLLGWAGPGPVRADQPPAIIDQDPPDGTWMADAVLDRDRSVTDESLGAAQGIVVRDGKVYAYGDVYKAKPRVGVIREYDLDLKPTGRAVWLSRGGEPVITHPTGLTWDGRWGTFLGDTVRKKAAIYRLDWERAWQEGNLNHAVLDVIDDDDAINGCRPLFVTLKGRVLLATADYGDVRPELRLCDPGVMLAARRTSAPGVVVHRVLCGPFNQNLHWDETTGRLTCIENVIEGRGWRLDTIDLARAVAHGRADGPDVRIRTITFDPHDELEGWCPVDRDRMLFVTSSRHDNIALGIVRPTEPRPSPPASDPPVGVAPDRNPGP